MNQIEFYEAKLKYEIDSWDLSLILENEDVVVVDTRSQEAYNLEHIPSAINIPHKTMTQELIRDWDRSKLYVCYCDGIGCNASTKGSLNLTKLGLNVKELLGGLDWWKRDGHPTSGAESSRGDSTISCGC